MEGQRKNSTKMKGKAAVLDMMRKFSRRGWRAHCVAGFFSGALKCIRPRKDVALENLRLAFPGSTDEWRSNTVKKCYRHLSWMAAEYLSVVSAPEQVLSWVEEVEGKEILDDAKRSGTGTIILTGHIGNWELLAAWLAQSGYPLTAVVRNPDDPNLAGLIEEYRARVGMGTFEKHFVMKDAIRFAKNGGFLGLLPDQAWNASGIHSPFLGRMCYTAKGPAAMAEMAGVPVIPVVSYRTAPFRHKVIISPPVAMVCEGSREERLHENTIRMNRAIEEMILRCPEQWLWFHRRWK